MRINLSEEFGAYFWGFMVGDGSLKRPTSVNGSPRSLSCGLQRQDRGILDRFVEHLGGEVKEYESNQSAQWRLTDPELCDQLGELGLIPGKSYEESFNPGILWKDRHCIRGLLDSDGGISLTRKQKEITCKAYFMQGRNNRRIVYDFREKVLIPGVRGEVVEEEAKSQVNYTGVDAVYFLKYVYEGSQVFLERKKQLAMKFIEEFNGYDWVEVRRTYDGETIKEAADRFGVPWATMKDFLNREGLRKKAFKWRK